MKETLNPSLKRRGQAYPTSRSSIAPGWKGGKLPPLGGSLGEYSLNDFDEQPAQSRGGVGIQRFRGDLDYFRFSSFKSQHHPSNRTMSDLVEIKKKEKRSHPKQCPAAFII